MRALGADDVNAPLLDLAHKAGDVGLFARQQAKIDHDRASVEETRRALHLRIQRHQPIVQRQLGRQHQRHDGAATQSDKAVGSRCCHTLDVQADWARVNGNRFARHKMLWITVPCDPNW